MRPRQRAARKVVVVQVKRLPDAARAVVKQLQDAAKAAVKRAPVVAKAALVLVAVKVDSKVATSAIYHPKYRSAFVNAKLSLADKAAAREAVAQLLLQAKTMEPNRSSN